MAYKDIILEKEGGIATITLNRPEKLNAISMLMREELGEVIEEVRADDSIRAVIVTGAGRGFCVGADIGAVIGGKIGIELKEESRRIRLKPLGWYVLNLAKLEKPTIAAVNGVAAGIGLSIALACDIRIASEAARFGAVWVRLALTPDGGATYLLPRILGIAKALELMFSGDIIDAWEAERIGLVSRVVPPDELMKVTKELAGKIAKGPPITMELTKRAVYRGVENDLDSQINFETYIGNLVRATQDHQEGVKAYMEKREPQFKGV